MKNLKYVAAGTLFLASSAIAGPTIGTTINLTLNALGNPGADVYVNYTSDTATAWNATAGTANKAALAGRLRFNNNSDGGFLYAYCVEINEGFNAGSYDYTWAEPTSVPEHQPPGEMSDVKAAMVLDLWSRRVGNISGDNVTATTAAAFQMVVWEITHENLTVTDISDVATAKGELSIDTGAFSSDWLQANENAIYVEANAMIASIGVGGLRDFSSNIFGLTNPTQQDLLTFVVPSPAIAGLAGLGLVGMRRRRR